MSQIIQDFPQNQDPFTHDTENKFSGWSTAAINWFQQVTKQLNRQAPRALFPVTVTASPFTYRSNTSGDLRLAIAGGTMSNIQMSRDGTNYYSMGSSPGQYTLSQNDFIRITYTVAPTIQAFPA